MSLKNIPLSTQAIYLFVGKFLALIISVCLPVILVRMFSKEDYGLYLQIIIVITTLVEIAKWGVVNSLYYFYSARRGNREALLSQSFYFLLILGLITSIIILYFNVQIYSFLNIQKLSGLIWVIITYVIFMSVSLILDSIYVLEKKILAVVIYEVANKVIKIAVIFIAILVYGTIFHIVYFLTIYAFMRFIFLYLYLKRNYGISVFKVNKTLLAEQIKYCFPIGAARLVGEVGKKADKFILIYFLSPTVYSVYAIAYFGIPIISLLFSSVSQVIIPKMALDYQHDKKSDIKNLWHKTITVYALFVIPIIFLFQVIADELIIFLFTKDYIDSVIIYQIFLMSMLLHIFTPSVVLRAVNKTSIIFYSHFLAALTALVFGYILIQSHGMIGGAVSFSLSSGVRTIVQLVIIKKFLMVNINNLIPWKFIFLVLFISIGCALIVELLPISSDILLISLVTSSLIYAITIVLLYLQFKIIKVSDIIKFYQSVIKVKHFSGN